MATELRKIDFDLEELHMALLIYADKAQRPLPAGEILSASSEISGLIRIDYSMGEPVTLKEKDLTIALLLLCRTHNIPVARDARKSLTVEGNVTSLLLRR